MTLAVTIMTTEEQLDRVEMIVTLLDRNARRAIALTALFERSTYDGADVRVYFDNSPAAAGYNSMMDAIYFELVVTVARLHDNPTDALANNTASIPVALNQFNAPDLALALRQRLLKRHDPGQIAGIDSDLADQLRPKYVQRVDEMIRQLQRLVGGYAQVSGGHLLQRIRTARNEIMAHTATHPKQSNRLAYGNAEELLRRTLPFVSGLQSSVRSTDITYDDAWKDAGAVASQFWDHILKNAANQRFEAIGGPWPPQPQA